MAKTYEIPVAQTPKYAHAISSAANTNLDGSGTLIALLTAGAEGAIVSKLDFWAQATVTASRCNVFISIDGGTTWRLWGSALMAAYTVNNTTVQTPATVVDGTNPNAARRLPANAQLRIAIQTNQNIVCVAEYSDF